MTGEGTAAALVWAPLFLLCVICFPFMYTGQLQPAEPLLLCIMLYYVHYVYGLAAPLNLSRLSDALSLALQSVCW